MKTFRVTSEMFPGGVLVVLIIVAILLSIVAAGFASDFIHWKAVSIPTGVVTASIVFMIVPATLTVAPEGVGARWLWRYRLVPWRDVAGVRITTRTYRTGISYRIELDGVTDFPIVPTADHDNPTGAQLIADAIRLAWRASRPAAER